jgi:hypothetical protein
MTPEQKTLLIIMAAVIVFVLILLLIMNNLRLSKEKKGYNANYPSSYKCLDGHRVRSLSELMIDNFFFQNGIKHEYEAVILKTVNSADKQYKYDWYFPEVDVYVEFFGFSGKKYKENTEAKKKFYRKHRLNMIALTPDVLANVPEQIPEKFGQYWEKTVHVKHCPNCGEEFDSRL